MLNLSLVMIVSNKLGQVRPGKNMLSTVISDYSRLGKLGQLAEVISC
jgi:hypothetical protein